jgi:hypothetical protein
MKTADLIGAVLDYWVARAEGRLDYFETYISDGVAMVRTETI